MYNIKEIAMEYMRTIPWFLSTIVVLAIAGCTKSEGPTGVTPDPAKARERVDQANQILAPRLAVIYATQGRDTSSYNVSSANSLYSEALAYDPNNLHAHFGFAVTELFGIAGDPELRAVFNGGGMAAPLASIMTIASAKENTDKIVSSLRTAVLSLSSKPLPQLPAQMYRNFGKTSARHPFSFYQNLIETRVMPRLFDALQHLARILQDPTFAFYITPQLVGVSLKDSIRIDHTEIYLLYAAIQGVQAGASFLVAYNVDYDATTADAVRAAWQVSSPFLAFRPNGGQRMKDVKQDIFGMTINIQSAINFLIHETTHPGRDLIPYHPADLPKLNAAARSLDTVRLILTVPVTIQNDFNGDRIDETVTINIGSLFDHAIANFKAELPAYAVDVQPGRGGKYDAVLRWTATTYDMWDFPNPTLNGFLPEVITSDEFKRTFGFSSATWRPGVVIPWREIGDD